MESGKEEGDDEGKKLWDAVRIELAMLYAEIDRLNAILREKFNEVELLKNKCTTYEEQLQDLKKIKEEKTDLECQLDKLKSDNLVQSGVIEAKSNAA
jgi:predicted nuclease with TOPRIM domain